MINRGFFLGIFLANLTTLAAYQKPDDLKDLESYPTPYQDIYINGEVHQKGLRKQEEDRYQILKAHLDQYERPFTLLDIGAAEGYFAFRTAYDYKAATCIMIEGTNYDPLGPDMVGGKLLKICRLNTELDNIIFLRKKLTTEDMVKVVPHRQHYDVLLLFNVLHHVDWRNVIDPLLNSADYVFIENPSTDPNAANFKACQAIRTHLLSCGAEVITTFTREHTGNKGDGEMFLYKSKAKTIPHGDAGSTPYEIVSNFQEKYFMKDSERHDWIHGISLEGYLMLNGRYPSRIQLKKQLLNSDYEGHNDPHPANCIVTKGGVKWIDRDGKTDWPIERSRCLFPFTLAALNCLDQTSYKQFFIDRGPWVDEYTRQHQGD